MRHHHDVLTVRVRGAALIALISIRGFSEFPIYLAGVQLNKNPLISSGTKDHSVVYLRKLCPYAGCGNLPPNRPRLLFQRIYKALITVATISLVHANDDQVAVK